MIRKSGGNVRFIVKRGTRAKSTTARNDIAPSPYSWLNQSVAGPSGSNGHAKTPVFVRRIAVKENIAFDQAPSTASSSILQDYKPPFTATCLQCLLDEGAVVEGMTKMDEFGMGSTTSHLPAHYSPVYNPSGPPGQPARSAGGSSGGSAAAVADGSAWAALGTDTGGSVRLPAAYCGVVGFKPSYGMISRHGVIAYADSLDTVGILSKEVKTARQVYETISRPDAQDMTCTSFRLQQTASDIVESHLSTYLPGLSSTSLKGLRIGIPVEMTSTVLPTFTPSASSSLASAVDSTTSATSLPALPQALLDHLASLGASLQFVSLPSLTRALPAYYVIASAEASSNLARYGGGWFGSSWEADGERGDAVMGGSRETGEERRRRIRTQGFGQEVKKRLLAGTYALSADEFNNTYLKALYLRSLLRTDFARVLRIPDARSTSANASPSSQEPEEEGKVDVLLHPTAIGTAPLLQSGKQMNGKGTEQEAANEYAQDVLTVPASLAGLPAISVPSGRAADGWPVGVSLVSQWGAEKVVLGVAEAVEAWRENVA